MKVGIYASHPTDTISGIPEGYKLLRFYSNGVVVATSVSAPDNADVNWLEYLLPDIVQWFAPNNTAVSKGLYSILGNNISFSVKNVLNQEEVVIDYQGALLENKIILDSHSRYNNKRISNQEFLPILEIE